MRLGELEFVRSRTEGLSTRVIQREDLVQLPNTVSTASKSNTQLLPFRKLSKSEAQPYINCVPLVDLKFAAGAFSDTQSIDPDKVEWVELPDIFRPKQGLFVARVIGESMNRRIPNGSWCLFKMNPTGSRQGKVVVAQHRDIHDPEFGGSYTVKIYKSEKVVMKDGEWRHKQIVLTPDSDRNDFHA